MHILMATTEFVTESTYSGGLANCVADYARIYAREGNIVTVVTLSERAEIVTWEQGIKVHCVKAREDGVCERILNILFPFYPKYTAINKYIRKMVKQEQIDIIQYPSSSALCIKRPKAVPATVMMATYLPIFRQVYKPRYRITDFNVRSQGRAEKQIRRSLKKADSIFSPSSVVAKYGEYDTGRKITVIESPVLANEYELLSKEELPFWIEKKYFLFYGTLGYLKGIALIARTLTRFFENNKDVYFVFLGKQTDMGKKKNTLPAMEYVYKNVSQEYWERIIYKDETPNKAQLYSIVKNSIACVLPSRFDNLPNTCIEAMALGKIVIGTQGASFEQLITDNENGFLIEIDNEQQLLEKMEYVLKMSNKNIVDMGECAKEAIKRLAPQVIYPKMMSFYQETIDEFNKKELEK